MRQADNRVPQGRVAEAVPAALAGARLAAEEILFACAELADRQCQAIRLR